MPDRGNLGVGGLGAGRPVAGLHSGWARKAEKQPWPDALAGQARGVLDAPRARAVPATAETVAQTFRDARRALVSDLLETLASLGQARRLGEGRYGVG